MGRFKAEDDLDVQPYGMTYLEIIGRLSLAITVVGGTALAVGLAAIKLHR